MVLATGRGAASAPAPLANAAVEGGNTTAAIDGAAVGFGTGAAAAAGPEPAKSAGRGAGIVAAITLCGGAAIGDGAGLIGGRATCVGLEAIVAAPVEFRTTGVVAGASCVAGCVTIGRGATI